MARARNIKPGFFKNEILGVADPLYSILFEGLWVLADRAGRLEDRPLRIKGEVFPYRDGIDMGAMLDWLDSNGFIRRYEVGGKRFILVLEFVKHQNPHKNEAESILPAPEEIRIEPEVIGTTRADSLSSDSGFSDSLIADSGLPDSPITDLSGQPPAEAEPTAKSSKPTKVKKPPVATAGTWEAYSRAYLARYRESPVRNARVNTQMAMVVTCLGVEDAPGVAEFYVGHQHRFYVDAGHSVGLLLRDAEKLRTQWATGRQVTSTQALLADRTQTNFNAFGSLLAEAKEREHVESQP